VRGSARSGLVAVLLTAGSNWKASAQSGLVTVRAVSGGYSRLRCLFADSSPPLPARNWTRELAQWSSRLGDDGKVPHVNHYRLERFTGFVRGVPVVENGVGSAVFTPKRMKE